MNPTCDDLRDSLQADFALARIELADARAALRLRDTPALRARVELAWSRLDRILDTWLEARGTP